MPPPRFEEAVELQSFSSERTNDREVSEDRYGAFSTKSAYDSWKRSLFPLEWFHSRPERDLANVLDDTAEGIDVWVRLHINELVIIWSAEGKRYNADFLVGESDGTHWVVEVKADNAMTSEEVQAKRQAARRWVNRVNASDDVDGAWRYLLISESDIATAKGSWPALKGLGS